MTTEEMLTALYEKFSAEQNNYRAWLLKQTPEEIIQHSYEDVCCKGEFQNP